MGRMQFDPQALHDAVDARRRACGMTWADLSQKLRISTSTVKGMTKREWGIELDGVIGLCRWVGRTVESFAGGDGGPAPLPTTWVESGYCLRFDTKALYAALNEQREERGLAWDDVAAEIWPSGPWGPKQLKGLAKGGRAEVYSAIRMCEWLGRTIQSFQRKTMI